MARERTVARFNKQIFSVIVLLLLGFGVFAPRNTDAQCNGIGFTANVTKGCPLLLVKFSAIGTSSAAGTKFQWDFGNGFVNGTDTITNAFATPGQYTIKMQATLAGSNTPCPVITKDTFITVLPVPTPAMNASTGFNYCDFTPSTKVIFTDNTPNEVTGLWVINSVQKTSKTDTVIFSQAGSYLISLYSTNKYGCQGFVSKTLQLIDSIDVDICADLTVTQSGTKAIFSPDVGNTGSLTIIGYSWSFPGITPSSYTSEYPPTISYPSPSQRYDAGLTIKMNNGCTYTQYRKSFIGPIITPAFQTECAYGFEFNVDQTGGKGGFNLNFPNGNISPLPGAPPPPAPPGILSYPQAGNYSASITYTNQNGFCAISAYYPFFVKVVGPVAAFTSTDNQICDPFDTVNFINNSDTSGTSNVQYTWYVFDSTDTALLATNNKIGPTYNYDTTYIPGRTGKFGVSLVATGSSGCTDSVNTPNFIVSARPKSDFDSLANPLICFGSGVNLIAKPTPAEGKTFQYTYKWYVKDEQVPGLPDSSTSANNAYHPDSLGSYDVSLSISNGHCSSDTTKKSFFQVIGDITKTSVANNSGCLNPDFTTTASIGHEEKYPPNGQTLYHWYLDPNNPSAIFNIKFVTPDSPSTQIIINKSGCYGIYLAISTIVGTDTCTQTYPSGQASAPTICVGPALGFTVGGFQCPGDTVSVTNNSPAADFGYSWQVSPASLADILPSDTSKNIRVVFKADTCYSVMLAGSRTFNGATCSDIDTVSGFCFHLPHPDFYSSTPTFYCAPAVGTFVNTTTNPSDATGFVWDFGDGDTYVTTDTNLVSHVYLQFRQATYNITLTALNSAGCTETVSSSTSVNIVGPVPLFTMDKNVGCDSVTVHFINTSKNVNKFYFLNGDNNTLDSLSLPPHQYVFDSNDSTKDSIIFIPTLISLEDTGCQAFFQDTIKLYRTPSDIAITSNVAVGCTPLTVQFMSNSQSANGWRWDFYGNGTVEDSTDQNPVFTYTKPGKYRAKLTVTNHGQCPYTVYSDTITVAPDAVAGFIPSEKTFCGTQDISFIDTSKNTVRFAFDYGDGSPIDSNILITHKYFYDPLTDTGASVSFYPRLIAFNAGGCVDSVSDTITAYRLPVAGFTYSPVLGCNPLKVDFTDTSKYNFATEWDFDNNGTVDAYGKTVDYVYSPGLYSVKMIALSIQGCVDSLVKVNLVNVNPVPKADFSVSDSDICYQDSVLFTNLTEPADSIVQWSWKFNDPAAPYDTSSAKNPYFAFYTKGWHIVTLTAVDNRGCSDTISKRAVFVEDTIPPKNTTLLYVSVIDAQTIQVSYNKSDIPKFARYRINRLSNGVAVVVDTVNNVNDTAFIYAGTSINTSGSSYCFSIQTENQCNRVSFGSFPHCTILLNGTADPGPANLLTWTGYSGWVPGWYYIYKADSGSSFKKVDSVRGNVLAWLDTAVCDQTYCYYVAAKNDSSGFLSNSNSICIKTNYVRDNTPLYMHYATVANNSVVKLQWDSSTYKGLVGYQLGKYYPNKGWVDNYAFTGLHTYTDATAKVNDSSYTYRVQTIDKCSYLGPISNVGTSILLKQSINSDNVALAWNAYRNWTGGVQNYLVQIQLKNNQFKTVANLPGSDTTYTDDSVYNAIDTAYCYRVIAIENGTRQDSSMSNLTCAVLPSRVFVPNAFTPNGDSLNDVWKVSALSVYNVVGTKLTQFDAKVYNRWGTLVFESNDIYKGWDGTFNGAQAPADVYIYMVSAEGIDNRYIQLKGNITLLR